MCEDAQPICCIDMCENERKCENVNVKQMPTEKISWRELNKKQQLTTNINNLSPVFEARKNQVDASENS